MHGAGWTAVSITAPEHRPAAVSRTFHGRDVLAPAAAYLAAGVPLVITLIRAARRPE